MFKINIFTSLFAKKLPNENRKKFCGTPYISKHPKNRYTGWHDKSWLWHKEIFPVPTLLVAYKRPPNIKSKLIRSKVLPANNSRPKRKVPGMKKCNRYGVCPYVREGKTVQATSTNYKTGINCSVDCSTSNIIYLLGCKKCPQQYIGETERSLKQRFSEHKGYVNTNNQSKSTAKATAQVIWILPSWKKSFPF